MVAFKRQQTCSGRVTATHGHKPKLEKLLRKRRVMSDGEVTPANAAATCPGMLGLRHPGRKQWIMRCDMPCF